MTHLPQPRRGAAPGERRPRTPGTNLPVKGTGEFLHVLGALQHGIRSYLVPGDTSTSLAGAAEKLTVRRGPIKPLSNRERQVLALVASGQQNKAVAEVLSLSPLTVKSHLDRIGQKFGTGDRAGMVALALRAGLID